VERGSSIEPEQHWARATLVAGKAAVQRWTIDGTKSSARLVLGREPQSDWVIDSEGVLPQHLALQWNGEQLWVVPVGESFSLVNGSLLTEPLCVLRTTWLEFGSAVMILDASAARPAGPSLSRLEAAAERIDVGVAAERGAVLAGATYAPTRVYRRTEGDAAPPTTNAIDTTALGAVHATAVDAARSRAARAALSATVIAPLSRICPELGDSAESRTIEVPEPRLGKPLPVPERAEAETASLALASGPRPSFVRGVSLSADMAHALRFLERRGVRLGLALGAALAVSTLFLPGLLQLPSIEPQRLARAASRRPGASPPSERGASPSGSVASAAPKSAPAQPPKPAAAQPPAPDLSRQRRLAAEALIAGRYEQALPAYAELASATGQPVFETIQHVLERKLRARCEEREAQGGEPCAP
jgi:hypothetical protein